MATTQGEDGQHKVTINNYKATTNNNKKKK
jgi:hypothetical protein